MVVVAGIDADIVPGVLGFQRSPVDVILAIEDLVCNDGVFPFVPAHGNDVAVGCHRCVPVQ